MKTFVAGATLLVALISFGLIAKPMSAQSIDELNLQFHGFATQSYTKSQNNNWNTLATTDGSAAWTEAVINVSSMPTPKLRIAFQARYFLLGNLGNDISLDWAAADYKVNEKVGFRFGKVKTPTGLLNEDQDIDPSQQWILLPQSVYPIATRNSTLSHYGGVFYGTLSLGDSAGKLQYRAFGGERVIGSSDGLFQPLRDVGISLPNGQSGPLFGGKVTYLTPITGLLFGASIDSEHTSGAFTLGPLAGSVFTNRFYIPDYYGRYEHGKFMIGGEYVRQPIRETLGFKSGPAPIVNLIDRRESYGMATYKATTRLTAGIYYSNIINRAAAVSSDKYQKDWALSARYDFNPYLYLKAEEHIMDGTEIGYSTSDNASGLKPNDRMTQLKLGVSF